MTRNDRFFPGKSRSLSSTWPLRRSQFPTAFPLPRWVAR